MCYNRQLKLKSFAEIASKLTPNSSFLMSYGGYIILAVLEPPDQTASSIGHTHIQPQEEVDYELFLIARSIISQ